MNKKKVILILLSLIYVISISCAVLYFLAYRDTNKNLKFTKENFEKLSQDKKELEDILQHLKAITKENEEKIKSLIPQLEEEKRKNNDISVEMGRKDDEFRKAMEYIETYKIRYDDISGEFAGLKAKYNEVKKRAEDLANINRELEEENKTLEQKIEQFERDKKRASLGTVIIRNK